jgi:hypothetical protein
MVLERLYNPVGSTAAPWHNRAVVRDPFGEEFPARPSLPSARVKVRGMRGQALEMSEHARDWMLQQAATTGRVAARCGPAVFAVVFISAASIGLGMLLGVKSHRTRDIPWQMPHVDWNTHDYQSPQELELPLFERFPDSWSIPLHEQDELDYRCWRDIRCAPFAAPEHQGHSSADASR